MAPLTGTSQRGRFARPSRRTPAGPTPSGARQALNKLGGLRPGTGAGPSRTDAARVGKGTAGLALLAGAAGLALKKRDSVVATLRHDASHGDGARRP